MATMINTAYSTSTQLPSPPISRTNTSDVKSQKTKSKKRVRNHYNHVFAIHQKAHASPLSQDANAAPSFFGFKNLVALMLIVSNLRLMLENYRKYGNLISLSSNPFPREDLKYGSIVYFSVPFHLFAAYVIELIAAQQAKSTLAKIKKTQNGSTEAAHKDGQKSFQLAWYIIALAHTVNATLNLIISTYVVFTKIYHPGIGCVVLLHAIIVWLKVCSFGLTNRDLRHALLWPEANESLPELYASCPYPKNITLSNICYFWWAPTLVYQPVYPRTQTFRPTFVIKRVAECISLGIVIWIASAQYAAPLLHNSLDKIDQLDLLGFAERVMKLSTISLFCWLCGFYALFHSFLNALAEIMHFADRDFYADWWNVDCVRTYWTSWNKPVYYFMRRHIYSPMLGRGMNKQVAQIGVFMFSGLLHELLIGVPTHNVDGLAAGAMMIQVVLIFLSDPFKDSKNHTIRVLGNSFFWITFCIVGQPVAAIWYFYRWQSMYGMISKR